MGKSSDINSDVIVNSSIHSNISPNILLTMNDQGSNQIPSSKKQMLFLDCVFEAFSKEIMKCDLENKVLSNEKNTTDIIENITMDNELEVKLFTCQDTSKSNENLDFTCSNNVHSLLNAVELIPKVNNEIDEIFESDSWIEDVDFSFIDSIELTSKFVCST